MEATFTCRDLEANTVAVRVLRELVGPTEWGPAVPALYPTVKEARFIC